MYIHFKFTYIMRLVNLYLFVHIICTYQYLCKKSGIHDNIINKYSTYIQQFQCWTAA